MLCGLKVLVSSLAVFIALSCVCMVLYGTTQMRKRWAASCNIPKKTEEDVFACIHALCVLQMSKMLLC